MADAGTAYPLDKTIALLASHARILEYADSPLPEVLDRAAEGLAAMAETITCAAAPPGDGSALNTLFGIDGDLDTVLRQVRLQATTNLLKQGAAARAGCRVEELSTEHCEEARADAQSVVDQDVNLASSGNGVLRALDKDDAKGMVTGLGGLKVDSALVKGLRATFGKDAQKTGLIIAALAMAEREAQQSPGARRLREAIEGQLHELRRQREQGVATGLAVSTASLRELDTRISSLQIRLRGLQSEADYCKGELEKANQSVAGLKDSLRTALAAADAAPRLETPQAIEKRLKMALATQAYWTTRSQAFAESASPDADNTVPRAGDPPAPSPAGLSHRRCPWRPDAGRVVEAGSVRCRERQGDENRGRPRQEGPRQCRQVEVVVRDANRAIDSLTGRLFSLRSPLNRLIGDHQPTLTAAKNEQQARNFADLLVRDSTRASRRAMTCRRA